MLEGWYCRSIANNNADAEDDDEDSPEEEAPNYKAQYRSLKRKLKFLIYENECFQEALRSTQRKLLKVNRDKSFLLDRLLQYEKVDASFTESDETESSDDEVSRLDTSKRKKIEANVNNHSVHHQSAPMKPLSTSKKKKPVPKPPKAQNTPAVHSSNNMLPISLMSDGHMTPEEVERHLESRQTYLELVPEKAPPTVPTEMFSNDPSLDSESNEVGELETSPSNMGEDCLSVDMTAE
ncbi:INO80 complex subunit E isoform X1 [Neodiprion virginianus]|uniref:INO80 complex subunit E isoform X1 n=1 Tax=Neodiprion fabricii TaxID=2872261 RepID=UPI001ED91B33|nr:INO80 complex subunit E isoform X1 [Neodiprion fabricii]XP_046421797.1 INO80 complex subunit E isoform X1 [Neodiprion fabricii]XP_046615568.1 INO80 complex subunit E isoform X1 [Neodiprion virginianus]XP_046615570.1 INO80 complex subunit E isoform X1 [Neodiprion virginianus]